jgi:hypothetical protein
VLKEETANMSHRLPALLLGIPIATLAGVATAASARAHAVQTFGPYTIAVGWLHEPAYAGELNAVELIVKDPKGAPVDDVSADDLHVQISAAGVTGTTLTLEPSFDPDTGLGTPGEYDAAVMPTVPGDYTFRLSANVHGTVIDRSFTSGPTTFDTVHDAASVQFPVRLPSTSDIASRITRDSERLENAQAAAQRASDSAARATALAIAGLVAGVIGAGLGTALLLRSRRTAAGT